MYTQNIDEDKLKNIQIIDGALNCTFSVFQATDEEFKLLFPNYGQDILFSDEIVNEEKVKKSLSNIWKRPILKQNANGIHGTIFFDCVERKIFFPQSRKMIDIDKRFLNKYQREIYQMNQE
jgi:hypothetical protein